MNPMGDFEHVTLEPWASAGRNQYLQSPWQVGKHRDLPTQPDCIRKFLTRYYAFSRPAPAAFAGLTRRAVALRFAGR